jgi:hypothetical protein
MHGVVKVWMVLSLLNQMDDSGPPALDKDKIVLGILNEN